MSQQKSPYRLRHEEHNLGSLVEIGSLGQGDVFVRQGTPCMILQTAPTSAPDTTFIVNLQTGFAWYVPNREQVHPVQNVLLTFESARRPV